MLAKELYDRDFFEWTRCNAALLRARRFEEADIEHLAEEIEDIGKSQQRELESRLLVLLTHLLKYQARPGSGASGSWKATIKVQRFKLRRLLEQMPSLRRRLPEDVAAVYELAVSKAAAGTRLAESSFPRTCPFSLEQILDEEFFPD